MKSVVSKMGHVNVRVKQKRTSTSLTLAVVNSKLKLTSLEAAPLIKEHHLQWLLGRHYNYHLCHHCAALPS